MEALEGGRKEARLRLLMTRVEADSETTIEGRTEDALRRRRSRLPEVLKMSYGEDTEPLARRRFPRATRSLLPR